MIRMIRAIAYAAAVLVSIAAGPAAAQAFPAKTVRMIVPFAPGGGIDVIARLITQKLQEEWGQSVLLDYRPGAGAVLGTDAIAKASPDGYTTGLVITSHIMNPILRSDMPFDTLKDLSGVSMVSVSRLVLVASNSLEANNLAELIALAKKNPGKLTYASPGVGTSMHLAAELLKSVAGIDIVHIPYKGSALAYPDVMAGRVSVQFDTTHGSMGNVKSGKYKPIAITSLNRMPASPDIPTVAETLPGFSVQAISGVVVPSATRRDVVHKMSADINKALQSPDLVARMAQFELEPAGTTPEQFDAFILAEIDKWGKVVKAAGIRAD
jgi:tripartite-type tricarboxylate transporter receptor subunit TctC